MYALRIHKNTTMNHEQIFVRWVQTRRNDGAKKIIRKPNRKLHCVQLKCLFHTSLNKHRGSMNVVCIQKVNKCAAAQTHIAKSSSWLFGLLDMFTTVLTANAQLCETILQFVFFSTSFQTQLPLNLSTTVKLFSHWTVKNGIMVQAFNWILENYAENFSPYFIFKLMDNSIKKFESQLKAFIFRCQWRTFG